MTRQENMILAKKIRQEIKWQRTKGYTYKIFWDVVNYSSTDFYNFMRGYHMSDDNLLLLAEYIENVFDVDLTRDPADRGGGAAA